MRVLSYAIVVLVGALSALAASAQDANRQPGAPLDAAPISETVLVAGATGRTGRLVIALLKDKGYRVRAMSRDAVRAAETIGPAYDWVEADVRNPASLAHVMDGVDAVVSVIGALRGDPSNTPEMVDYGGVKALIDAALEHRTIRQFVLTSSGGVTHEKIAVNAASNNALMWKLKGEDYLRASGLTYTVVRALGLRDWAGGTYGILLNQGDDVLDGLISRADVAAVIVESLANPDARRKTFEIFNYKAMFSDSWRKNFSQLSED